MEYRQPSAVMARWSMILGIIAIVTSPCILPAVVLGALAIILGLLSRGGQLKLPTPAITGVITGVLGIISGASCFIAGYTMLIEQYGSYENFMNEYMKLMGY
ncbi:MAG: hypothetical protein K6F37_00795 [Lachnospiraceae bacterium]|nr:hypothetical protein [Lachnospiraceae bacterium]